MLEIQYRPILHALIRSVSILILASCLLLGSSVEANDFLTSGEVAGIAGGSLSLLGLSLKLKDLDTTRAPLIKGPLPLETSIQRFFGGECKPGKRNFLDDTRGSVLTPAGFGLLLTVNDLGWPQGDKNKEFSQDMFLYLMGLAATKGITHSTKAIVSRPRPYVTLGPIDKPIRNGFYHDRTSFFSGHASTAFFAATFVNLRIRATMQSQLTASEYRNWRWAPSTLSYGWATFVGLSRIQAYKHYLSDVLIGAGVGYLLGELFFSFAKRQNSVFVNQNSTKMVRFRFSF